tara:strand:- start:139 stop:1011 length:873 start_codon:yes stop_codon:yes gene_type:complete
MTSTIVLKSSNITDPTNAVFKYDFPNSVNLVDYEVALISASMYYSWNNISTILQNRTFQYQYIDDSDVTHTVTVTLDEGLYEISDLNKALQFSMINEGLYLIDSNGEYIYYLEFVINSVRNSVDINTYPVPDSHPGGFTSPTNWVGYPSVSYHPNLIISSRFNEIVGYAPGFETGFNSGISESLSYSSSKSPNVNPNSSILVDLDCIDNKFSLPTGIISTIVPDVGVGSLINVKPNELVFSPIRNGVYNSVTVRLLNKDTLIPQKIEDDQIVIILGIRKKYSFEMPTDRY